MIYMNNLTHVKKYWPWTRISYILWTCLYRCSMIDSHFITVTRKVVSWTLAISGGAFILNWLKTPHIKLILNFVQNVSTYSFTCNRVFLMNIFIASNQNTGQYFELLYVFWIFISFSQDYINVQRNNYRSIEVSCARTNNSTFLI